MTQRTRYLDITHATVLHEQMHNHSVNIIDSRNVFRT
jgi:hypothetical protein